MNSIALILRYNQEQKSWLSYWECAEADHVTSLPKTKQDCTATLGVVNRLVELTRFLGTSPCLCSLHMLCKGARSQGHRVVLIILTA